MISLKAHTLIRRQLTTAVTLLLQVMLCGGAMAQQVGVEETFGDGGQPVLSSWTSFAGGAVANIGDGGFGDHAVHYIASGPSSPGFHFLHPAGGQPANPDFQGDLRVYDDVVFRMYRLGASVSGSTLRLRLYIFNFNGDWAISTTTCNSLSGDTFFRHCRYSLDPAEFTTSGPSASSILSNVRQIGFRHDPDATGPGIPVPVDPGTQAYFDDVQLRVDVADCGASVWVTLLDEVSAGDTFTAFITGDFETCGLGRGSFDIVYDPLQFDMPSFEHILPFVEFFCTVPGCLVVGPPGRVSVELVPNLPDFVLPGSGPLLLGSLQLRALTPGTSRIDLTGSFEFGSNWWDVDFRLREPPTYLGTDVTVMSNDADNDGVQDTLDNCLGLANPAQIDADFDNIGNPCDQDISNDCVVNAIDLGLFRARFFSTDAVADFNSDGVVNVIDLGFLRAAFFGVPGPSGLTNACE